MCGRYRLSATEYLEEVFEAEATEVPLPRYNIAPSQPVQIVRGDNGRRVLVSVRWGLVPFWAKDLSIGYRMINARSETVLSKPAFREAFATRRCLIPADGFYEWKRLGSLKQPFHFGMKDNSLFAFASGTAGARPTPPLSNPVRFSRRQRMSSFGMSTIVCP